MKLCCEAQGVQQGLRPGLYRLVDLSLAILQMVVVPRLRGDASKLGYPLQDLPQVKSSSSRLHLFENKLQLWRHRDSGLVPFQTHLAIFFFLVFFRFDVHLQRVRAAFSSTAGFIVN